MALTKINNNTLSAITGLPAGVGGKVLQVVSASSTSAVTTSSVGVVTFMNASITPSSSSNKIFCMFNGLGYANGSNVGLIVRLYRGTISDTQIAQTYTVDGGNSWETYGLHLSKLDTPSTTSSQQYTIGFTPDNAGYTNMGLSSNNSTLTLMEIAG